VARPAEPGTAFVQDELTARETAALDVLTNQFPNGATYAEWQRASDIPSTTFDRTIKALRKARRVERWPDEPGGRYYAVSRSTGATQSPPSPPSPPHGGTGGSPTSPPQPPHPVGVGVGGEGRGRGAGGDDGIPIEPRHEREPGEDDVEPEEQAAWT